MKRFLFSVLFVLSMCSISFAKEYKVIEVDNSKEISLNTLSKLFDKADYKIYLDNFQLTKEKLNTENENNTYHYIGYTEDNKHFFERVNTVSETEEIKETETETETTKKKTTVVTPTISPQETTNTPKISNLSNWIQVHNNHTYDSRTLVSTLQGLPKDTLIYISILSLREAKEYTVQTLTADELLNIGRQSGNLVFQVACNPNDTEIYLTN